MSEQPPSNLRIATWNLKRPRSSLDQRAAILRRQMQAINADVWILTETHCEVSPGPEYEGVATHAIEQGFAIGEHRTIIWARLPVKAVVSTHDPETAVCVELSPMGSLYWCTARSFHISMLQLATRFTGPIVQMLPDSEVGSCTTNRSKGIKQIW